MKTKLNEDMSASVAAYKDARLYVPQRFCDLKPNDIDALSSFPLLDRPAGLDSLKAELPLYLAKAGDVPQDVTPVEC